MTTADHRRLGRDLDLFDTDPLIGAGLPFWLPDGATVRHTLEEYVRGLEREAGYVHVYSPALGKRALYEKSGHWAHYRDGMFPPLDDGGDQLVLRPSLCPHHALLYRSRGRSHRELPLRVAELGDMYRQEPSGSLGGLTRVRAIRLNDAHIFCTPDQVVDETANALDLIGRAHRALGITPLRHRLSLPGPGGKYAGEAATWQRATGLLVAALEQAGLDWEEGPGEAAFYGPKIDVQIADPAGRESTLSTVQVDLHQPERFDLHYTGPDGARHRPVMVHRSVIGSIERVVAHLTEVHQGAFPAWLAPLQAVALPVTPDQEAAAAHLADRARRRGLRADTAPADTGALGARIRTHRLVPYQAVIGAREAAQGTVAVRLRDGRRLPALPAEEFLDRAAALAAAHTTDLWDE
ncbi:threonine--tRNA ligase [Nocardiopsis sp. NPDC057823]|uniref:threonine--tRNA ligase n=1 Tax=Nocardiopsis sp. NPDC057823 TaxID=3346256 RepID=UPI00366C83C9